MAVAAHITELIEKHRHLEDEIREELTHPGSDSLKIAELKRRKLRLKEEIERLRTEVH
jgi:hypothetical protein